MKTNMKNKAILLTLLFLGLQPFCAVAMDNQTNDTPVIIEESQSNEGIETITALEEPKSSWLESLPTLPSLPELPGISALGVMAQHMVDRMVVSPFNSFVDSNNGLMVPGGFLLLDNVYTNTLGNRNEALTRKSARWMSYGILLYKVYRLQSMLSQMHQGINNIQSTQELHTQEFQNVLQNIDTTKLEIKLDLSKLGQDIKKIDEQIEKDFKKIIDTQGTHTQQLADLSEQQKTEFKIIKDTQVDHTQQIAQVDTKVSETKEKTESLTGMFTLFLERSALTDDKINKVLERSAVTDGKLDQIIKAMSTKEQVTKVSENTETLIDASLEAKGKAMLRDLEADKRFKTMMNTLQLLNAVHANTLKEPAIKQKQQ